MKLSEIELIQDGVHVLRDGEFMMLGLTANKNIEPTLSFLADPKYLDALVSNPCISCAIMTPELADTVSRTSKIGIATSADPKYSFFCLHNYLVDHTTFYSFKKQNNIDPTAIIHPLAWIDDCNVSIGPRSRIGSHVAVFSGTVIGADCSIGAGTVIGADGFECFRHDERMVSVHHAGGVKIEDNVDIHSNTCIDQGLFGTPTIIKEWARIDNLVHIAHNVIVGKRAFVVANAMVAGRVVVGDDAWIGPSASVRNGYEVAAEGFVSMGAVVTRNVASGQMVSGNFAIDHEKFIRFMKTMSEGGNA